MYRYDKHGLLLDQHPTKMPYYIAAVGAVVALGFAVYEFSKSAKPTCDTSGIPASEIVQDACNHPVPQP